VIEQTLAGVLKQAQGGSQCRAVDPTRQRAVHGIEIKQGNHVGVDGYKEE